jgi:alpha-mannosidase
LFARAAKTAGQGEGWLEVFNTSSWNRTDLVSLSEEQSRAGDRVTDIKGNAVPSQRLSSGELVFLARNVPGLGSALFRIQRGAGASKGKARATGTTLASGDFTIEIDAVTGGIKSLFSRGLGRELADPLAPTQLNSYFYLPGSNVAKLKTNATPRITVKEHGPLVASILIEGEAPGCRSLKREVRLVDGLERVEIINTIDKLPVREKEGLHFGFGFNVPEGEVRLDVGLAMIRPDVDQIPASCKNWFTVQRWADISNKDFGVTWAPLDAPLVELGGLTANLVGSQTDWRVWRQRVEPTQTLYSWVMNNHWHTNYRAEQEGPTVFRYAIWPHRKFSPETTAKVGTDVSQPFVLCKTSGPEPTRPSVRLSSDRVAIVTLKPSDDGKATILRLFGYSGKSQKVTLKWRDPAPSQIWLSDTSEEPRQKAGSTLEVPAWALVTLRVER